MEPIRIVLADMPRMLRETLEEHDADFVITGADVLRPDDVDALLEARPRMKVLAVVGDGRDAFLYELRPQKVPLGEVSPHTLLEAIRAASWARA